MRLRSRSMVAALGLIACPLAADDVLDTLQPEHPRLLVRPGSWGALDELAKDDEVLGQFIDRLRGEADRLLTTDLLKRRQEGRRLLAVSREALHRITTWAAARHFEDQPAYAARAEAEMRRLAAFRDWNPPHFLDVAEMTTAMALGYDWLYHDLSDQGRVEIRDAIVRLGLRPGQAAMERDVWWSTCKTNWNQVCLGGLTLGALAVAEEFPDLSRRILEGAREGIGHGLSVYAPDGIYPEGPGYWNYGTLYQCLMIDGLRTALGTSWSLEQTPGFLASARAQRQLVGPSGRFFNFGDGTEGPSLQPALFWFTREGDSAPWISDQRQQLVETFKIPAKAPPTRVPAIVALWWPPPGQQKSLQLPLAWQGEGEQSVAVFRSDWSDSRALYLACKAGSVGRSHDHLDAGSFVFEADGVRWAVDLGPQGYQSLESKNIRLWDCSQESQRWEVFRLNNRSHNTLTLDDRLHRVNGSARFIHFDSRKATIDLSEIFKGQADKIHRHFEFSDTQVTIRDELEGLEAGTEVRWNLVTRAKVQIDGRRAMLRQDGKQLRLQVLQPARFHLRNLPADPPDDHFNAPNPGARIIAIDTRAPPHGNQVIEIQLTPAS